MRWKRERVGTRSQIEMSLFLLKTSNIPLVFIGSYERVLPDLTRGREQTQTPEKSAVKEKRKKAKLRPTLYRNHKNSKEELGSLVIILFELTLREFYTSPKKPHKKKNSKRKCSELTLNCDDPFRWTHPNPEKNFKFFSL
jgi:hypothetical protein